MEHDIVYYAKKRHTAKAYDAAKTIPKDTIEKIKDLLRFSPSSINVQPWYFILASSDEGKARVAKSTEEKFSFNKNNILDASHVVVFCNKLTIEEPYLLHLLEQESADGRYKAGEEAKQRSHSNRSMFLNVHKGDIQDERHWIEKQVYINLGQFLLGWLRWVSTQRRWRGLIRVFWTRSSAWRNAVLPVLLLSPWVLAKKIRITTRSSPSPVCRILK